MPSILSKILMPEWNLPYNCYELGHTWTPLCSEAALETGLIVFTQSLKLYAPLYLGHQVISRKFDSKSFKESLRSILRSSVFLGINAFLVIAFFCLSRHILGRFYYTLCAYVPSFFGSLLAILAERPSRRRALAFYVANIASETLYRILVSRGYLTPVPHGQFLLFGAAVTSLIYLFETGTLKDPLIQFVFKLVLGSKKAKQESSSVAVESEETERKTLLENDQLITKRSVWQRFVRKYEEFKCHSAHLLPFKRHPLCPHRSSGCLEDILLSGLLKPFLIGYTSQLAFRTVPKLLSLNPGVVSETLLNPRHIFSSRHTAFGLVLASFTALYKTTRCGLRWTTGRNEAYHSIIASLVAAPTQFINPSTSVTLYLVWKSIEAFFNMAASKGLLPYHSVLVNVIYAMACAEIFYAAVLDPSHIKPSYKRFLDRVTEKKLRYINRNVLEVFGTNSASGYEALLPIYELAYTTRRFQESVLVWLL